MKEKPGEIGFPTTFLTAKELGYVWRGLGRCKGKDCGLRIHWYETPNGRKIPINDHSTEFVPHWKTCPHAAEFRRKRDE